MTERRTTTDAATFDTAVRLLARRPLTEHELRLRLATRGHDAARIETACSRLRAAGYLDDQRLAMDFILARSERLVHGPARLIADLERRGVPEEAARAAMHLAIERGDVVPAERVRARVRERLGDPPRRVPRREYARMYNALRRAGFDEELIRRELEPYHEETDDFA